MKKYKIVIEETCAQEFEIEAMSAEKAMMIAEQQYVKGVLVLEPGELQFRQMAVISTDGEVSEWTEF